MTILDFYAHALYFQTMTAEGKVPQAWLEMEPETQQELRDRLVAKFREKRESVTVEEITDALRSRADVVRGWLRWQNYENEAAALRQAGNLTPVYLAA